MLGVTTFHLDYFIKHMVEDEQLYIQSSPPATHLNFN